MTRYYGLYARHREIDNQLHKAVPKSKHRILLDFNTWRKLFLLTMGYDPLQCPNCRHEMVFLELYHKHERVPLDELYKRTRIRHGLYPRSALLDFLSHLLHTTFITDGRQLQMNQRYVDELRQKYIKNPPEGMTPKLVRNMTDSDLLDMHYFLTEDDDLDDDGWEEGFYIDLF